jgi:DNA-binding beta-propeller fold protein YncE
METIRTIELTDLSTITARDIVVDREIRTIDINQIDGSYVVVEPYDLDDSYYGRVMLYPQSPQSSIYAPTELKTFDRVGSLYYPQDAKFDYVRGFIWIADTGNNRVLKVDLNTKKVRITIKSVIYPYALTVDLNTGNVFIKGYSNYTLNYGSISHYGKDGSLIDTFIFNTTILGSSSSSSSDSSESGSLSLSSSSSSSLIVFPEFPSSKSIVFDNSRSRLWWLDENTHVYMADIRGKYINSYDLANNGFSELKNLDVELATGNAFIVARDCHSAWAIAQVNRDCNKYLSRAWVVK